MRENFIINPDKNNGYPSFSDANDIIDVDFFKNPLMMQLCGDYPVYRGKSYLESTEIKNTDFHIFNNYPELHSVRFSLISGAFANAKNLKKVTVSPSVKFIGETAFRNTQIKNITVDKDCTYSETSFPDDCAVDYY
ncbi:MAG: leucine-rich repeat domain-containing protein [Oscillospiraceae bacterium]|nr:leucine-rich repeat domain-containing protein [Oscillospiraceae bacterium]